MRRAQPRAQAQPLQRPVQEIQQTPARLVRQQQTTQQHQQHRHLQLQFDPHRLQAVEVGQPQLLLDAAVKRLHAAALAWTLGAAVDAMGGAEAGRGSLKRRDGGRRQRATPRRVRLWRLRRELFALPGRIARHARELKVSLLGVGEHARQLFKAYWGRLCRC